MAGSARAGHDFALDVGGGQSGHRQPFVYNGDFITLRDETGDTSGLVSVESAIDSAKSRILVQSGQAADMGQTSVFQVICDGASVRCPLLQYCPLLQH